MKQFSVGLVFDLSKKPEWLDEFRKKFDKPYHYHITLKQDTFLNESEIGQVKEKLNTIASNYHPLTAIFSKLFFGKTPKGHVVMIEMEEQNEIRALQKELHEKLSTFGEIILPYAKSFEENFKPHISIARNLDDDQFEEAKNEIGDNTYCEAQIKSVTLNISEFKGIPFSIIEPDIKEEFPFS